MTLPTIEQLEAMLANATKGPWADGVEADEYSVDRAEDGYDGLCWSAVGAASAVALVVVPCRFGMNDIQAANAALIALAPTLATQRIADAKRIAELEAALTEARRAIGSHAAPDARLVPVEQLDRWMGYTSQHGGAANCLKEIRAIIEATP